MKYIKINQQTHADLMKKFQTYLETARLTGETLDFKTPISPTRPDLPKAQLYITAEAYVKILLYVRDTSTEIAWHGTVVRDKNAFLIKDVMLYPQTLAAATVTTDQERYNEWIINLDDNTHNQLRFQGHSHVNFGATPSGTDLDYYNQILQVLPDNDFYIFMIINKPGDMSLFIYDLAENIIYEKADIDFHVINGKTETNILDTIEQQKLEYCTKPVTTYNSTYGSNDYNSLLDYEKAYSEFRAGKTATYTPAKLNAKYNNVSLKKKGRA